MPLMYEERTVAIEAEATYGTLATLTNADAGHRFEDPKLSIVSETVARGRNDGLLGPDKGTKSHKSTRFTGRNWMHGNGSSGAAGFMPIMLPCVGMPSNDTNSFRISRNQTGWKGMSAGLNRNGRLALARGLMGDLTISIAAGEPFINDWSFMGGYQAKPTDSTQLTGMTFEDVTPPTFDGSGSFTLDGSTAFKIAKATLKLNTQPFLRKDPNAIGGHIGGWLKTVAPTIEMDPEAVAVATKNWHDVQESGDTMDIIFVANGGSNNTVTITAEDCELLRRPEDENRDGVLVDALGFVVTGDVTIAVT